VNSSFVTFAVGNRRSLHRQANFAVISLLARSGPADDSTIFIVTDQPECYRWLVPHVTVIAVDAATLKDWRGPHDYFWRIKLKVMQRANEVSPGHLIYLDSDVVCRPGLAEFFSALDEGTPFMHKNEYALGLKGGGGRELCRQVAGRRFGKFSISADSRMWNAGVVALPAAVSRSWIADALECLDAMCAAGVRSNVTEQFSLSASLSRDGRLQAADPWFIHYWSNKLPWNGLVSAFLADVHLQQLPMADVCERFRNLPLDLPLERRRSRLERVVNSVRKRVTPRDHGMLGQLGRVLNE